MSLQGLKNPNPNFLLSLLKPLPLLMGAQGVGVELDSAKVWRRNRIWEQQLLTQLLVQPVLLRTVLCQALGV